MQFIQAHQVTIMRNKCQPCSSNYTITLTQEAFVTKSVARCCVLKYNTCTWIIKTIRLRLAFLIDVSFPCQIHQKVPKSSSLFEELALNPVTSTPPYLLTPSCLGALISQACRRPTSTMDVIGIGPDAKVNRYTGWVGRWIDRWICRDRIFTCIFFWETIWNGGHNEKHSFRSCYHRIIEGIMRA